MISGLKTGDLVFDPRRAMFLPSSKAVVCSGLLDALEVGIAGGLRDVLKRVDSLLSDYSPDAFVLLGDFNEKSALEGLARRWGARSKLILISPRAPVEARDKAEVLGCEVHQELIWGSYRFLESAVEPESAFNLTSVVGKPSYALPVGKHPFAGMKLAVFLKGPREVLLPAVESSQPARTVFEKTLDRFDVFAVGHHRVLPVGKVADLRKKQGMIRGLPISKLTLGAGRKQ